MSEFRGEGWWEQNWCGRQPMNDLMLTIQNGVLNGTGWDLVGVFSLRGQINGSQVVIIKHYLGRHQVQYLGTYDGEGVLAGEWRIDRLAGRWLISLSAATNVQDAEINELK